MPSLIGHHRSQSTKSHYTPRHVYVVHCEQVCIALATTATASLKGVAYLPTSVTSWLNGWRTRPPLVLSGTSGMALYGHVDIV